MACRPGDVRAGVSSGPRTARHACPTTATSPPPAAPAPRPTAAPSGQPLRQEQQQLPLPRQVVDRRVPAVERHPVPRRPLGPGRVGGHRHRLADQQRRAAGQRTPASRRCRPDERPDHLPQPVPGGLGAGAHVPPGCPGRRSCRTAGPRPASAAPPGRRAPPGRSPAAARGRRRGPRPAAASAAGRPRRRGFASSTWPGFAPGMARR